MLWMGRRLLSVMATVLKWGLVTLFNAMAQCVAYAPGRRRVWRNMSGGATRWRHRDPCDPEVRVFVSESLLANLLFTCEIDVFILVSSFCKFFDKLLEWYHTIGVPFSPYNHYLAALLLTCITSAIIFFQTLKKNQLNYRGGSAILGYHIIGTDKNTKPPPLTLHPEVT